MTLSTSNADVYGEAFALYRTNIEDYDSFIKFLPRRLAANNIDQSIFEDKICLDAGCGSGRGSIFMLSAGAKKVTGIDLSPQNVETSRAMAKLKNFSNAEFSVGNVHDLPFEDEEFDIVWCNGVLHHTSDTDKGLVEITRVLKSGGQMWLYLYGAGGVEWAVVDELRDRFIKPVSYHTCLNLLQIIEEHLGLVSEFLDNWYTPYLKRYTHHDVQARLKELGFPNVVRLMEDVDDRKIDPNLSFLLGEQNLRYFVQKESHPLPLEHAHCLPNVDGKGSAYQNSAEVEKVVRSCQEIYGKLLEYEEKQSGVDEFLRTAISRALNHKILAELEKGAFDVAAFEDSIKNILTSLTALTAT